MSTKQLLNQFRGLFTFSKLWLLQTSKEGNLPTLGPMPAAPLPCERTAGSHSFLLGPQGLDAFTCDFTCHDVKMKLSRLKCVSSLCSGHATVLNRWSRNRKLSQTLFCCFAIFAKPKGDYNRYYHQNDAGGIGAHDWQINTCRTKRMTIGKRSNGHGVSCTIYTCLFSLHVLFQTKTLVKNQCCV